MMWKVQKEGELEKQSSGMFTTWNTHNFKLKNGAFWYVRKDGEVKPELDVKILVSHVIKLSISSLDARPLTLAYLLRHAKSKMEHF